LLIAPDEQRDVPKIIEVGELCRRAEARCLRLAGVGDGGET
jgi:hypothetical protein